MTKTKKPSLPPEEVAMIIEKVIPSGKASEFARRMGINEAVARKYAREGIKIEAVAWAFRAIDKQPSLLGGQDPPGASEFDKGALTAIAAVIALFGIKQARVMLIGAKLEHADISGLPEDTRTALLRLNSYHGIKLTC